MTANSNLIPEWGVVLSIARASGQGNQRNPTPNQGVGLCPRAASQVTLPETGQSGGLCLSRGQTAV